MTVKSSVILSLLLAPVLALKAELPSATELLARLEQLGAQTNTSEAVTSTPLSEAFLKYQKAPFGTNDTSAAWLNILDLLMASDDKRLFIFPEKDMYYSYSDRSLTWDERHSDAFTHLLLRLPPPSSWPAVREGLEKRAAAFASTNIPPVLTSLQFVFDTLDHDTTSASNRLATLSRAAQRNPAAKRAFRQLERALKSKRPPSRNLIAFIIATRYPSAANPTYMDWISFPEEFQLLSDEKLWEYAAPALTNKNFEISYCPEGIQHRLVKLALDHLDVIEQPALGLFEPTDDGHRLFNALVDKFNILQKVSDAYAAVTNGVTDIALDEDDEEFDEVLPEELEELDLEQGPDMAQAAQRMAAKKALALLLRNTPFAQVICSFLDKGDLASAKSLYAKLPPQIFQDDFYPFPANAATMDFIETELLTNKTSRFLAAYTEAAITARQTDQALAKIDELEKSAPAKLDSILAARFTICNAMDLSQAMADNLPCLLRQIVEFGANKSRKSSSRDIIAAAELAVGFFGAETNLQAVAQIADALIGNKSLPNNDQLVCKCAKILDSGKQSDKALELIFALREKDNPSFRSLSDLRISTLLNIYFSNGRHQDVVDIIENYPETYYKTPVDLLDGNKKISVLYARSLEKVGRKEEAARLASFQLTLNPVCGEDWPYEILVNIWPADKFNALMDRLYAIDKFEERPLIWKAECLRRAGRLEEAESIARKAVETDPTDGETDAGDRVRSYAVLAQILAERGNTKEAEFFGNVVKAVRIAEEGDALANDELLTRSMAKYAEAEKYFSAAYCVQWRIAERMRALGLNDLADAHYEESFRQMPAQFGAVASLCLGCNGIFDNPQSVSAAEKILTRIAASDAPHPTACYLLGELRTEQNRYEEACEAYTRACTLKPDYLDALNALLQLQALLNKPRPTLEATQNRILALDPLGLHSDIYSGIFDWGLAECAKAPALAAISLPQPGTDDVPDWVFPGAKKAAEKETSVFNRHTSGDPLLAWTLEKTRDTRMTDNCAWLQSLAALLRILQPELSYQEKDGEDYSFAPSAAGFGDYDYSELDDFLF